MEAKRNLCDVFGEEAVTDWPCKRWLMKFYLGDLFLNDEPRSGRSSHVKEEVLRRMIRTNPTLTSKEVGVKLVIHQTNAFDYIKRLGFVFKLSVWVPHELSKNK
ncbi:histone-lysine N-methyltransferase SETMAR [Trichonephila clavipes]|nr:histone-lysine N-methyltransferase SETMAR [Trichonephila clavipes]